MDALLGALALFLVGLLGARLSFTASGIPLGARFLLIAGTHFLFLGFLLGPGIGLLSRGVISQLFPLVALGLSWVGLLYGMQLELRTLRRFPARMTVAALVQAVVAYGVFLVLGAAMLAPFTAMDGQLRLALFAAAATACCSSTLGVSAVAQSVRGKVSEMLLYTASLDSFIALVALQLVYALQQPLEASGASVAIGAEWLAAALAVGVAFSIFLLWLTRPKPDRDELMLYLLGTALFLGGTALFLGVSILFVAMVAGILFGNISPLRRRVFQLLQEWEKPIYVILLLLLGALVELRGGWTVVPLALGYAAVRVVAKLAGGWAAARIVRPVFDAPPQLGLGLLTQGGMSLAITLGVVLAYGGLGAVEPMLADFVVAVVIGVILSELIGPRFARNLLRDAGEIEITDAGAQPVAPGTAT